MKNSVKIFAFTEKRELHHREVCRIRRIMSTNITKFGYVIEYLEGEISVLEDFKKRAFKRKDAKIIGGQIKEMKEAIKILKSVA